MELKEALIRAVEEVFPLFGMNPKYVREEETPLLTSAADFNVLNSFAQTLQGNIIFGFERTRALKIASLTKGENLLALDLDSKITIGEIATLAVNIAIGKYKTVNTIYISSPVLITGDNIQTMISHVKATKLFFELQEDFVSVAYHIEQNEELM